MSRRRARRRHADDPHVEPDAVLRAHRDRAAVRLAGESRAGEGAVSRRRFRRQGLRQARSAGRRAGDARPPAGQDRADHGRAVLHDHQASDDVPHQKRRRQGRPRGRARLRGVLERRRLCRYRPARDAEIRLHRGRPLRHRQCQHRFLRALHQPHAGRRVARLRRSATGLGLREPHRPDRARARHRSGRIPPQEYPARRPAAGERHRDAGRRHRRGARCDRRAHGLERAVRSRHRHAAPRPRHRHRLQGLDLADHVGRDRQCLRRRQRPRSTPAPSTWGRAPTPRSRRSSPKCSIIEAEERARRRIPIPT